ncbi:MAG: hypothetical protein ACK5V0_08110 [Alphaproteobacteria bacterium]|jgi:hypothetical protein
MKYLTFILGAGASVAYGLPTGDELVQRVATHMLRSGNDCDKKLGSKLELYAPLSIDSYLMKHYSQEGRESALRSYKAYIAFEIMQSLQNASLGRSNGYEETDKATKKFSLRNPENWMRFVIPELLDLYENYPESECPIKFVIFNYDLSLEFYLDRVISEYETTNEGFKKGFFKWISEAIVHLYGQVGFYSWQKDYAEAAMNTWQHLLSRSWARRQPVPSTDLQGHAYELQKHIRVIGEPTRANDAHVTLAKEWITKSYSLVFTGYGFNEDNNKLLELSETSKSVEGVICGFFGMGGNKERDAKDIFNMGLNPRTNTNKTRSEILFQPRSPVNHPWLVSYNATTHQLLKDKLTLSKLYQPL